MVWTYVPGPNIALACAGRSTSTEDKHGPSALRGSVFVRPSSSNIQGEVSAAPEVVMLGQAPGMDRGNGGTPRQGHIQGLKVGSAQVLPGAASRPNGHAGWRFIGNPQAPMQHTGMQASERAVGDAKRMIKAMYARMGMSGTRTTDAASPMPQHARHPGGARHGPARGPTVLDDGQDDVLGVVNQLQRIRPYTPVYRTVPVALSSLNRRPKAAALGQGAWNAGALPQTSHPGLSATSHPQPPVPQRSCKGQAIRSATGQRKKRAKGRAGKKLKAAAGKDLLQTEPQLLPELPTAAWVRSFQLASPTERPNLQAAWEASRLDGLTASDPAMQPSSFTSLPGPKTTTQDHAHSTAQVTPQDTAPGTTPTPSQGATATSTAEELRPLAADASEGQPLNTTPLDTSASFAFNQQHTAGPNAKSAAAADGATAAEAEAQSSSGMGQQGPEAHQSSAFGLQGHGNMRPQALGGMAHRVHVVPTRQAAVASAGERPATTQGVVGSGSVSLCSSMDLADLERLVEEQHTQLLAAGFLPLTTATAPAAAAASSPRTPHRLSSASHVLPAGPPPPDVLAGGAATPASHTCSGPAGHVAPAAAGRPSWLATAAVPAGHSSSSRAAPAARAGSGRAAAPGALASRSTSRAAAPATPADSISTGSRLAAELRELGIPLDGLLADLLAVSPAGSSGASTPTSSLSSDWSWAAELRKLGIH